MKVSSEPLRAITPIHLTNLQLFARVAEDADAEALQAACEKALGEIPGVRVVHARVNRFTVARPVTATPATNTKLDKHHLMVGVEACWGDGDVSGMTACNRHMVASTTGKDALKKAKCDDCYAALAGLPEDDEIPAPTPRHDPGIAR